MCEWKRDSEGLENNGGGGTEMVVETKPIRSAEIVFENEEEYIKFMNYATSKQKLNSPEIQRLRELIRSRIKAEMRERK